MSAAEARPPRAKAAKVGIVIVGGGLAGLFCALKLAPQPVTVLAAAPIGQGSSSAWAQAGIAAAVSHGDSVEKHLADTIEAGAGIVDAEIARAVVADGPHRICDLLSYGVPFDRDLQGRLVTAREAAHSQHRVVGVRGDMAGKAIMQALIAAVRNTPSIRVIENHVAEDLLVEENRAAGILARHRTGPSRIRLSAGAVVLCTGGVGHLYKVTTNPAQACGGGLGMAARAGAMIADPEFVQFHPTAIDIGRDPAPLATEALRGHGATLVNASGQRFMADLHPDAELAPRDVVARGIFAEIKAGRGAYLDCTRAVGARFVELFPTVHGSCMSAGIDPACQPIPVAPAAHYHMGGLLTGLDGRTTLDGLWAAGEVTSTGTHGANRLASNSLLEAVVFAGRVAEDIQDATTATMPVIVDDTAASPIPDNNEDGSQWDRLRRLMGDCVGVVREQGDLRRAARTILEMHREPGDPEWTNALTAAALIVAGALHRTESRGAHYRSDFPDPKSAWQKRTILSLSQAELLLRDAAERTFA